MWGTIEHSLCTVCSATKACTCTWGPTQRVHGKVTLKKCSSLPFHLAINMNTYLSLITCTVISYPWFCFTSSSIILVRSSHILISVSFRDIHSDHFCFFRATNYVACNTCIWTPPKYVTHIQGHPMISVK